jgi:hypothetical protein
VPPRGRARSDRDTRRNPVTREVRPTPMVSGGLADRAGARGRPTRSVVPSPILFRDRPRMRRSPRFQLPLSSVFVATGLDVSRGGSTARTDLPLGSAPALDFGSEAFGTAGSIADGTRCPPPARGRSSRDGFQETRAGRRRGGTGTLRGFESLGHAGREPWERVPLEGKSQPQLTVVALAVRFLEVRRHSVRDLPNEHLSEAGRRLAKDVGRTRGPFQIVVSSPAPRAQETALAMGFPPTKVDQLWYELGDGSLPWPLSFSEMREQFDQNPRASNIAARFWAAGRAILTRVPEMGSALIVAHGGVPELLAASRFGTAILAGLGAPCKCMEGIYLSLEGKAVVAVTTLRVPEARTRI